MEEKKIDYETEEQMQEVTEEMLEVEPVPKTSCTVTKKMAKTQNEECATTSSANRRQIDCPLASCKAKVVHLPRHMRNVHHWTKEAAAKVLHKYNMRKTPATKLSKKTESSKRQTDYHLRRLCPVGNCHSIVLRFSKHLQRVHKLTKTSKEYRDAIKMSKVVSKEKHATVQQKKRTRFPLATQTERREQEDDDTVDVECPDKEQDFFQPVSAGPVISKFEKWLSSPDGGKRDEKTVKQHSAQLMAMLNVIDESCDVTSLLDTNLVSSVFLETYVKEKNYEAGTTKSYLMSLRHFYSFLLSDNSDDVTFNADDVRAAMERIRLWSTSFKRETCTRRWKKLEEDEMNRLKPEDVKAFERSDAAREAIKTIGDFANPENRPVLNQNKYILVRDFLLAQIFIDNANRPGVLSFMTMDEFHNMRMEGDGSVISVMKHKTAHIHGPAYIVLSQKLKGWLTLFVQVMRPDVTTSTSGSVFLTWNGQTMTSSQINKALQSIFKKATISSKITSTSFRKAAVTNVHERNPEFSSRLAGLMAHNESTAKKYYLLSEKTKASVEASTKLAQLMRGQDDETCKSETGSSDRDDQQETLTETKRVPWTNDELQKVKASFDDEIREKNISLPAIRAKVNASEQLKGMSPRRIYDKLKKGLPNDANLDSNISSVLPKDCETLQQRLERMVPPWLETTESVSHEEQSSISIVSPTERSGMFSDESIQTIKTIFSDMILLNKPISKPEIQKRCSETKDGKQLLSNLTILQLVNRIKYERRKKREQQK